MPKRLLVRHTHRNDVPKDLSSTPPRTQGNWTVSTGVRWTQEDGQKRVEGGTDTCVTRVTEIKDGVSKGSIDHLMTFLISAKKFR